MYGKLSEPQIGTDEHRYKIKNSAYNSFGGKRNYFLILLDFLFFYDIFPIAKYLLSEI